MTTALTIAGCSQKPLDGTVWITGSATMLPLMSQVVGDFSADNQLTTINMDLSGTTSGMLLFCDDLADMAVASRPMSPQEADDCAESGVQFAELLIARDAVVPFTKPDASVPQCLTFEDLYALSGPESGAFQTWQNAQVLASELGSDAALPDVELSVIAPDAENGTRGLYLSEVIEPIAQDRNTVGALNPNSYQAPGQAALISAVLRAPAPLAFVGYARLLPYGEQIQRLEIDAGQGCVAPTPETINDGSFPLSRPLYIYVNVDAALANPTLMAMIDTLKSPTVMTEVASEYALNLTDQEQQEARNAFNEQMAGRGS
jgi:phosphate transport system substrate-binding protein